MHVFQTHSYPMEFSNPFNGDRDPQAVELDEKLDSTLVALTYLTNLTDPLNNVALTAKAFLYLISRTPDANNLPLEEQVLLCQFTKKFVDRLNTTNPQHDIFGSDVIFYRSLLPDGVEFFSQVAANSRFALYQPTLMEHYAGTVRLADEILASAFVEYLDTSWQLAWFAANVSQLNPAGLTLFFTMLNSPASTKVTMKNLLISTQSSTS